MKNLVCALSAFALFVSPAWAEDDEDEEAAGEDA